MSRMYHQYFGLKEAPFSIAVNPRYLFMSARHRDALAHLLYGVGAGGGFILLTGEVGTGKTTINRCLLEQLPHDTDIAIILNPALNAMELLATACDELEIEYDPDNHTLKTLTDKLHDYLLQNHQRGRKTVLMIDEAQHLDFDVLEQIRLLTNLETNSEKLLQIILIGQPELAQLLARPELRQLNQRITARYNLEPLNQTETGAYIHHRLQVAGMAPEREIFPASVVRGIYKRTRGIPRLINVLCDRILLGAYGRNKAQADVSMLKLAAREVMGEEVAGDKRSRWPLYMVLLLAVGLAAGWYWNSYVQSSVLPPAVSSTTAELPVVAIVDPREPETTEIPEPAEVAKTPVIAPLTTVTVEKPRSWLLAPEEALGLLWRLSSAEPAPEEVCSAEAYEGVACIEGDAGTWDELADLDYPLLLKMVTPERFAAAVVMLGMEGHQAWLATPDGVLVVNLAELGSLWREGYRFLWHPPQDFQRPLAIGDKGPVIAEVAALFARLDGQSQALANQRFNKALQQRVRLFQRSRGLDDDGVVGVQTLLELNAQLGIDTTTGRARERLAVMNAALKE